MKPITSHKTFPFVITLAILAVSAFTIWSCKEPGGMLHGNAPPRTRLANVPVNDDSAKYYRNGAIPEVQLSWVGDDEDGFVIAYRYRWTSWQTPIRDSIVTESKPWITVLNITQVGSINLVSSSNMILVPSNTGGLYKIYNFLTTLDRDIDTALIRAIGDSLETERPFAVPYRAGIVPGDSLLGASKLQLTTPTNGAFIFSSLADSNMHRFQVKAVDNENAEDPAPASVHFWTQRTRGPLMRFYSPLGGSGGVPTLDSIVLRYKTERWPGARFTFASLDASTFDQEYQWKVDSIGTALEDSLRWSDWSSSNDAYATWLDFDTTRSNPHRFYVRGKNRFGAIGAIKDTTFSVTHPRFDDPSWPRKVLIINNNVQSGVIDSLRNPDSTTVKRFYSEVLDAVNSRLPVELRFEYAFFSTQSRSGQFPTFAEMSDYSTIIIASELFRKLTGIQVAAYRFSVNPKQSRVKTFLQAGGNLIFGGVQGVDNFIENYAGTPQVPGWGVDVFHIDQSTLLFGVGIKNRMLDYVGSKVVPEFGYPVVRIDSAKVPVDSSYALRDISLCYPRGFARTISLFDSRRDSVDFENRPLGIRYLSPAPIPPARADYSVVYFGWPPYFCNKNDVISSFLQAFLDFHNH